MGCHQTNGIASANSLDLKILQGKKDGKGGEIGMWKTKYLMFIRSFNP